MSRSKPKPVGLGVRAQGLGGGGGRAALMVVPVGGTTGGAWVVLEWAQWLSYVTGHERMR